MEAITFDDILLVPGYNHHMSRRDVETKVTDKANKLSLELPVISANMDTITESEMVNFMGKNGAMGSLHRFMDIEKNVEEFKKCKFPTLVSVGLPMRLFVC